MRSLKLHVFPYVVFWSLVFVDLTPSSLVKPILLVSCPLPIYLVIPLEPPVTAVLIPVVVLIFSISLVAPRITPYTF